MRLICGPVNDVAAAQRMMPPIAISPEGTTRHNGDMHILFSMIVHRENIANFREVVDGPVDLTIYGGLGRHHLGHRERGVAGGGHFGLRLDNFD